MNIQDTNNSQWKCMNTIAGSHGTATVMQAYHGRSSKLDDQGNNTIGTYKHMQNLVKTSKQQFPLLKI